MGIGSGVLGFRVQGQGSRFGIVWEYVFRHDDEKTGQSTYLLLRGTALKFWSLEFGLGLY